MPNVIAYRISHPFFAAWCYT